MSDAVLELEEKRKELVARRQLLEERFKYREATAAEFGVVHQKALRRTRTTFAKQCSVASMRNQDVLRRLKQANEDFLARAELKASDKRLLDQRTRFQAVVSSRFPTWHEEQLHQEASRLQELERDKLEVEVRRQLAREAFEREQALRVELERKRHELAAAQIREKLEEQQRRLQRHRLDAESHSLQRALELQAQEESRHVDMEMLRTKAGVPAYCADDAPQAAPPVRMRGSLSPQRSTMAAPAANQMPSSSPAARAQERRVPLMSETSPLRPRREVPRGVAFDSEDAAADYYANFDFVKAFNEQVALEDSVSAHVKWLDQRYQQNVVAAAATTAAAAAAAAAGQQLHQRSAAAAAAQGSPAEAQQQQEQQQYHHYQQQQHFSHEAWDSPHSPAPAAPTGTGNFNLRQHVAEVQVSDAPGRDGTERGGRTVSLDVFNANPGITATFAAELSQRSASPSPTYPAQQIHYTCPPQHEAHSAQPSSRSPEGLRSTGSSPQHYQQQQQQQWQEQLYAATSSPLHQRSALGDSAQSPLHQRSARGDSAQSPLHQRSARGDSAQSSPGAREAPRRVGEDLSTADAAAALAGLLRAVERTAAAQPGGAHPLYASAAQLRDEHIAAALNAQLCGSSPPRGGADGDLAAAVASAGAVLSLVSVLSGELVPRAALVGVVTVERVQRELRKGGAAAAAAGSAFEALRAHVCGLCGDGLWTADQAADALAAALSSAAAAEGGAADDAEVERAQRKVAGLVRTMAQSEHSAATPAAAVTSATAPSSRRSSAKAPVLSLPGALSTSLSAMMQEIDEFDDGDGASMAAAGATLRAGDDDDNF